MAEFAPYLLIPFFLFWIFGVIWSGQRKKPQAAQEPKAGEGETHSEALRRILGELNARLEEGELEELRVDEWALLRRAEQN